MEEGSGGRDMLLIVLIFVSIGIVWLTSTTDSPGFVFTTNNNSLLSTSTLQSLNNTGTDTSSENNSGTPADPAQIVTFSKDGGPQQTTPADEHIMLFASEQNTRPVSLAGWKIQSAITGESFAIPQGVRFYTSGITGTKESVTLNPGEWAVITTGRSPVGESFLINKCTGYLTEHQVFSPSIRKSCPFPNSELPYNRDNEANYSAGCFDYLDTLPQCRMAPIGSIPVNLPPQCHNFIATRITYNGCVSAHRNDKDFSRGEWRLFLGRNQEIWKASREELNLVDPSGKVVDSWQY